MWHGSAGAEAPLLPPLPHSRTLQHVISVVLTAHARVQLDTSGYSWIYLPVEHRAISGTTVVEGVCAHMGAVQALQLNTLEPRCCLPSLTAPGPLPLSTCGTAYQPAALLCCRQVQFLLPGRLHSTSFSPFVYTDVNFHSFWCKPAHDRAMGGD